MWSDINMLATMISGLSTFQQTTTNGSWHDYKINGIVYELLARSNSYLKALYQYIAAKNRNHDV